MKIRNFIFKFVDHDTKMCTDANIIVYSNKFSDWEFKEEDIKEHATWMAEYYIWMHFLKKEVKKIVHDRFFPELSEKFGDYKIKKISKKIDDEMININKDDSQNIIFRQKKSYEMINMKFVRGTKPKDWGEVFDYTKTFHNLTFMLDSNEMDRNIVLIEVSSFSVPIEKINVATRASTTRTNPATASTNPATASTNPASASTNPASASASRNIMSANPRRNLTDVRDNEKTSRRSPRTAAARTASAQATNSELITMSSEQKGGNRSNGTTDARTTDARSTDARTTDMRTTDARSTDARSTDARTTDMRSTDMRSTDARSTDARSSNRKTSDLVTATPNKPKQQNQQGGARRKRNLY